MYVNKQILTKYLNIGLCHHETKLYVYTVICPHLQTNIRVFIQTCKISSISQNGILQLSTVGKSRSFPFTFFPLFSAPQISLFGLLPPLPTYFFFPPPLLICITYISLDNCLTGNLLWSSRMQWEEEGRARLKKSTQNISVFQPGDKTIGSKYKTKA